MPVSEFLASSVLGGSVRYPRLRVFADDKQVLGAIEAEVLSNNHYGADRFTVDVALDADPAAGPSFWASQADLSIDIQIGLDGQSFESVVQGAVDTVELDLTSRTVRLCGRDRTAALIETRTQETFSNRTASEIAHILAERHGLTAVVTDTSTPVGRYYQDEHDRITLDQFSRATTEWDLLVFLARQEGFDVYVAGSTLFFQPASGTPDLTIVFRPEDVLDLKLERSLTLARDIEVVVKSWNSRQQKSFTQTAKSTGKKSFGGKPQRYVYVRPNLMPDQALKLAQQLLSELTRHERVITAAMPGELTITPRTLITLQGTGTDFDQTYHVDEIERHLRVRGGFTQRIRAKNVSPQSQTTTPADIVESVTG